MEDWMSEFENRIDSEKYKMFSGIFNQGDQEVEDSAISPDDMRQALSRIDALLPKLNQKGWILRPGMTKQMLAKNLILAGTNIDMVYYDVLVNPFKDENKLNAYGIAKEGTEAATKSPEMKDTAEYKEGVYLEEEQGAPNISEEAKVIPSEATGQMDDPAVADIVTGDPTKIEPPAAPGTGTVGLIDHMDQLTAEKEKLAAVQAETQAEEQPVEKPKGIIDQIMEWLSSF